MLIRVDFPPPLAPTRPVTPSPTVTSRWSSAVTDGYCFVSPTVSITATQPTYDGPASRVVVLRSGASGSLVAGRSAQPFRQPVRERWSEDQPGPREPESV